MYLLDTDIIIYSLKGDPIVVENIKQHAADPKHMMEKLSAKISAK